MPPKFEFLESESEAAAELLIAGESLEAGAMRGSALVLPNFLKATFREGEDEGCCRGLISTVLGEFEGFSRVLALTIWVEVAQSLRLLTSTWLGHSSG